MSEETYTTDIGACKPSDFGEYIALVPLNQNGKSPEGETYLFRFSEEGDNPVVSNIEREDEYMAAAEAFHDFISNLKSEKDLEN